LIFFEAKCKDVLAKCTRIQKIKQKKSCKNKSVSNIPLHLSLMEAKKLRRRIQAMVIFFMIALALSGITAFPLEMELTWLLQFKTAMPEGLAFWFQKVNDALHQTNIQFPFLAYGYDWLAFAHLMIALMFIGVLKNPVRNVWVIEWAMIACICVWPLAFIAGSVRGIPLYWQLIDCSFGVFGLLPLWMVRKWIKQLEKLES
jgi:hypothetical protein